MSYIFEDFPEEFLRFEDIVGEDIPCHDDYLDERFAPIPGHPDYFISTFGRVYSLKSHQFLTLKKMDRQGHVGFSLSEPGGKPDYVYLHRLMAVNLETGEETEFRSQTDAGRELGIQQANIWKVLNGERRSAGGYYFEYLRRGEEE